MFCSYIFFIGSGVSADLNSPRLLRLSVLEVKPSVRVRYAVVFQVNYTGSDSYGGGGVSDDGLRPPAKWPQ